MKEIYLVWWQDAYVSTDHLEAKVGLTLSVGWLVKKDKEFFVLSHFWDGISNRAEDPYTFIPHGMIKKIEKIWTKSSKKKSST